MGYDWLRVHTNLCAMYQPQVSLSAQQLRDSKGRRLQHPRFVEEQCCFWDDDSMGDAPRYSLGPAAGPDQIVIELQTGRYIPTEVGKVSRPGN